MYCKFTFCFLKKNGFNNYIKLKKYINKYTIIVINKCIIIHVVFRDLRLFIVVIHWGQYHLPFGGSVIPTHSQWYHSYGHCKRQYY